MTTDNSAGVVRRLSIFGGFMFLLVLVLYLGLTTHPERAVPTSLIILSMMCLSLLFFVWNEMTYHHYVIEIGDSEYEIASQVLDEASSRPTTMVTKTPLPEITIVKNKHKLNEEAVL